MGSVGEVEISHNGDYR